MTSDKMLPVFLSFAPRLDCEVNFFLGLVLALALFLDTANKKCAVYSSVYRKGRFRT